MIHHHDYDFKENSFVKKKTTYYISFKFLPTIQFINLFFIFIYYNFFNNTIINIMVI